MRRSSTLNCIRIAVLALPLAAACATSQSGVGDDAGNPNGSSSSGSGNGNGGNTSSGSSGTPGSSSSSGSGSGTTSSTSSGSGSGTTSSTSSGSGSGTTSSSSGSGSGATSSSSSGSGSGASSSSSGAGGTDAGATSQCGTPAVTVLSDFEITSNLVPTTGRNGWWYDFADTLSGTLVPTPNATGPILTVAAPAGDTKLATGDTCNKGALATSTSGHTMFAGVGATFSPAGTSKNTYSLAAYDGIQFDIQNEGGNQPLFFEMIMQESQTQSVGGLLTNPTTADPNPDSTAQLTNTRGYYLTGAGGTATSTSTVLPSAWTTVYVPFSLLIPRRLPNDSDCDPGIACESPPFVPTHGLGFQFAAYPDMNNTTGSWNFDVDNVELYTGDNGLVPGNPTAAATANGVAFNDGAVGFASCKASMPKFQNGARTASGKYLLWAYNNWKGRFFKNGTVIRPENGNDTVSEGIGYGMLLSVYFNDQTTFDALFAYEQAHLATGNLMTWCIPAGGGSCPATGGTATDADEDIAFALVEAGKRTWSTSAKYAALAPTVIGQVWTADIDATNNLPKGGSNYGAVNTSVTNPSYFAPAYYRKVFAAADTTHAWAALADHTIAVVTALGSANRGLVPAWCQNNCTAPGTNSGSAQTSTDEIYQYDAHRVPWRMSLDFCWNGTAAAQTYANTISGFFTGVYNNVAAPGIDKIFDLYNLNGTSCSTCAPASVENSASIIGTAGVGAMAAGAANATFVTSAWQFVLDSGNRATIDVSTTGAPSIYSYFNATVGLLTALTMSGNFYPM